MLNKFCISDFCSMSKVSVWALNSHEAQTWGFDFSWESFLPDWEPEWQQVFLTTFQAMGGAFLAPCQIGAALSGSWLSARVFLPSSHLPWPQGLVSCLPLGIWTQPLSLGIFLDLSAALLLPHLDCHSVSIYHECSCFVSSAFLTSYNFPFFLESAAGHYKYNVTLSGIFRWK